MKWKLFLFMAASVFFAAESQNWLELTVSECLYDMLPCASNTREIILYKSGLQTIFTLDAAGANSTYENSLFNKDGITTVFIHGYVSGPDSETAVNIREAYSSLETTTNFFIVNATEDYGGPFYVLENYMRASHTTKCVGQIVGEYLSALYELGVSEDNIHLIGHSLGAQTVHSVAEAFTKLTNVQVLRATGLDPAGPCFDPSTTEQLNSNDAKLVDIIHSNSGVLGTTTRLGQANFIPNGGSTQEGCGLDVSCSHSRAVYYYSESIVSTECIYTPVASHVSFLLKYLLKLNNEDHIEQLGYRWEGGVGLYDAKTSSKLPFCLGLKGINI